ncbi:hypothetical protein TrVFT333_011119 [Trichoderma virens FT-333]|nr:hypothetical protein TrVFT333_011119 [Trichoderma virens FT-333]
MDVTSLLNNAQQPCYGRGGIADSSKNLNHGKLLSSPNALGIPWEEDSNQSSVKNWASDFTKACPRGGLRSGQPTNAAFSGFYIWHYVPITDTTS